MRADALPPEVERELAAVDDALAGRPSDPELAHVAELTRELRATRPPIRPEFAADLDERVAAGFPREPGRLARWLAARPPLMPGIAFAASLLLALVVSISVLGDREGADQPAQGGGASQPAVGQAEAQRDAEVQSGGAGADSSASTVEPDVFIPPVPSPPGAPRADRRRNRLVERSASLTLATEPGRLEGVAADISQVTDDVGGFVLSSSVSSSTEGPVSGSFQLRVPSARLADAMSRLSRLADVRERRQDVLDITGQAVSARDRLAEARALRRSLLRRLARADSDDETRALRAQLRHANARIRAARADLARVRNRATFSNISVMLVADAAGAAERDDGVWSPGDAARDAVRVLEVIAGVALIALAVLLPLALLGVLGLAAAALLRRRRRERALDAG